MSIGLKMKLRKSKMKKNIPNKNNIIDLIIAK